MKKSKNHTLVVIIASVLLALLFMLIFWLRPNPATKQTAATDTPKPIATEQPLIDNTATKASQNSPNVTSPHSGFVTGLENLPRSLQGTQVDGDIIIDENKQLVVTRGLRRLFDYFLSTQGEETEDTIHQRVEAYIRKHTPEPAASDAVQIYHSYVQYLKALSDMQNNYGHLQMQATQAGQLDMNLLKQRRQDNVRLRQQHFNAVTIAAFFDEDDAFEDYTVAMMAIQNDPSLSAEQKKQAKQDYIQKMPNNQQKQQLQAHDKQQILITELMTRTEQLKKSGASADELYAMRVEMVGAAAAKRLATLDKQDADFDARFNQYQQQKNSILANYSSEEANAEIAKLERNLFSESEAKRLHGYAKFKQLNDQP